MSATSLATTMPDKRKRALRFVLLIGVMSLFADFTYEGARGIAGPFLAALGASGAVVGIASGLGEFLGYALRVICGRRADKTRAILPIPIADFSNQRRDVPSLSMDCL